MGDPLQQYFGQFLMVSGRIRVSDLFPSSLDNEKSRFSALAQKSALTIDMASFKKMILAFPFLKKTETLKLFSQ